MIIIHVAMSLNNDIKELSTRYEKYRNEHISESDTESWFVRPFLRALGYDTSDPDMFSTQYPADPRDVKTGKVDFALLKNGKPVIFVEAKKLHQSLNQPKIINQIKRYFNNVRKVDFVILTNGNEYRFFTDLDHENMLDEEPFLVFTLSEVDQEVLQYLELFSHQKFDSTKIKDLAGRHSRREKIYAFLEEQFMSPSDEFAKALSKLIFGTAKLKVRDGVKKSLPHVFSKLINTKTSPPIIVTPGEEQGPVETSGTNGTEPPTTGTPSGEQDPFKIDTKFSKLEYFRFQDKIVHGTWTDMFVFILTALCQRNDARLISSFAAEKSIVITHDQKLIRRYCVSIGNGLFTSTNRTTRDKIKHLRTALTFFDMQDTLRVKLRDK